MQLDVLNQVHLQQGCGASQAAGGVSLIHKEGAIVRSHQLA